MNNKKYLKVDKTTLFDLMVRNELYQNVYKNDDNHKTGHAMQKTFIKNEVVKYFDCILNEYFNMINDYEMKYKVSSKWNKSDNEKYIIIELDYNNSIYNFNYILINTLNEWLYNKVLQDTNQILNIKQIESWQV